MKLFLVNREQLQSLGSFLVSEFDSMVARIRGAWNVEHNDDDTHGHVHADSVATGRVVFSDIVTAQISQAQYDNFAPGGIETAALLRLTSGVGTVVVTGIQVPRDENGVVLDGRTLVVENGTDHAYIDFSFEDTNSVAYNRFLLPGNVACNTTRVRIAPKSLLLIVYNAPAARWLVHGQSSDNMVATYSGSTNDNDFAPTGFQSCGTLLIDKSAAAKTISGFDTTNIPSDSRRRITNGGLYAFEILHANTGSLAANRVYCPGQVRYRLHPRETVELYRQSEGGWKLVASGKADQWIDVTYAAGTFTTDAGTWTVGSSDQTTLAYHLDGNKLTVSFDLRTTSVATSPTQLRIALPQSKIVARTMQNTIKAADAGAEISTAYAEVVPGETFIRIYKNLASGAWSNATDTTRVTGQITFMVRDDSATISEPHSDVAHGDAAHSDAAHSDVAHVDVAHGDSHGDSTHTDVSHGDTSHVDSHSDDAHADAAHTDVSHIDTHDDVAHGDVANTHSDTPHGDHDDLGAAEQHNDQEHGDGGSYHVDTAHSDSHNDTAHSDVAHTDVSHNDSHSDTAHSDSAHGDTGHSDSHSDTVPHSDVTHIDVAHGDTVHADSVHSDVGMHYDTSHVDI